MRASTASDCRRLEWPMSGPSPKCSRSPMATSAMSFPSARSGSASRSLRTTSWGVPCAASPRSSLPPCQGIKPLIRGGPPSGGLPLHAWQFERHFAPVGGRSYGEQSSLLPQVQRRLLGPITGDGRRCPWTSGRFLFDELTASAFGWKPLPFRQSVSLFATPGRRRQCGARRRKRTGGDLHRGDQRPGGRLHSDGREGHLMDEGWTRYLRVITGLRPVTYQ